MFFPSSATAGGGRFLIEGGEQVVEHSVVLGEDDGRNFKLALQSVDLLLEVVQQFSHLLPLLHLLEKLYQTGILGERELRITHVVHNLVFCTLISIKLPHNINVGPDSEREF